MNNCSAVKYRQIEERAAEVAHYIVENNVTVRQAAKAFGISKSTIHMVVAKWNGLEVRWYALLNKDKVVALSGENLGVPFVVYEVIERW